MNPAGDKADEDDAPPVPGMLATTPERAAAAERAEAGRAAAESAQGDGPTVLGPARMKELKDKARAEIEQRLKERRKKRRLLRGGDASGGFSIS